MVNDQLGQQLIEVNQNNLNTQQRPAATTAELRDEKEATKQLYASIQNQLATAHALASISSGGSVGGRSPRKPHEPIVCHKLMLNKSQTQAKKIMMHSMNGSST